MSAPPSEEFDDPAEKHICVSCVGDSFLKSVMTAEGDDEECSYCSCKEKTISIEDLADRVERTFNEHYERTATDPDAFESAMLSDRDSNYEWERRGEEVLWAITEVAMIDEGPAEDVLSILEDRHSDREAAEMQEETEFDSKSFYQRKELRYDELLEQWTRLETSLKTRSRFFNREAHGILAQLFSGLATLRTSEGKLVVVEIGPDSEIKVLHRARVFAGEDAKLTDALAKPWKDLGPPPVVAATAGRMNARGISVFYGAVDSATALAEVRPPVGSRVGIAQFSVTRTLRLLDVEMLKSVRAIGSVFDPNYLPQAQLAGFMETLSRRIVRPVMPNEEAFEYLATQAIADYLATEAELDGIIFPSVQTGHASSNVVLFHHASRIEDEQLPKGMKIDVRTEQYDEDGSSPDYWVWEEVPSPEPPKQSSQTFPFEILHEPFEAGEKFDPRTAALRIDLSNVFVHHVTAVTFSSYGYLVRRHRTEKPSKSHF